MKLKKINEKINEMMKLVIYIYIWGFWDKRRYDVRTHNIIHHTELFLTCLVEKNFKENS